MDPLLHEYEYGETPPLTVISIDPVEFPVQRTSVTEYVNCKGVGTSSNTSIESTTKQFFASNI